MRGMTLGQADSPMAASLEDRRGYGLHICRGVSASQHSHYQPTQFALPEQFDAPRQSLVGDYVDLDGGVQQSQRRIDVPQRLL